ncbi:MAG TPA: energy transducer TonB [Rhizomicrobium sp.]|jgi:protein TonB|nr:energy transducer TonB [Rhizomicrobium sp.]
MHQPIHAISQPGARWTTERIVGVGFVAVLHVIAIGAILTGLTPVIIRIAENPIHLLPDKQTETVVPLKPLKPIRDSELPKPSEPVAVPKPTFTIAPDRPGAIQGSNIDPAPQPSIPDSFAAGIVNTHTIPEYPALARRLGEQGSVRLSLTISAAGDVVAATVVQSSGYADLDQTAVDWVIGHWKYKPAVRNGVAINSTTAAAVVFNLRTAR